MPRNKKHITKEDFQRYLKNRMTDAERNAFERELQKNPFELEAMEGFQHISHEELSNDLNELQAKFNRKKPKSNTRYWAAAATFLLLVSSGIIWFQLKDKNLIPKVTETKTIKNEVITEDKAKAQAKAKDLENENEELELEIEPKTEKPEIIQNLADNKSSNQPQQKEQTRLSKIHAADSVFPKAVPTDVAELNIVQAKEAVAKEENKDQIRIRGASSISADKKSTDAAMPEMAGIVSDEISYVVKGKVVSEIDNQPVPGAVIQQKGTKYGTISDNDGNFALQIKKGLDEPLVVSFVGMESEEFYPKNDSLEIIELQPSQLALEEVVVTKKSSKRKKQTVGYTTIAGPVKNSPAQPVGGIDEFEKYLEEKAVLNDSYSSKKAVVKVRIHLSSDGEIIRIENSNHADLLVFEKAKQIILEGPEWLPEFKNGENIGSEKVLKIVFRRKN